MYTHQVPLELGALPLSLDAGHDNGVLRSLLKHAGLVTERREGTKRLYRARPEGLEEIREFLNDFWEDRLQLLANAAETEERRKRDDNS